MLQISRRSVQAVILFLIVAMPLISFYGRILSGKGQRTVSEVAISEEGKLLGTVYVAIDKIYRPVPNAREAVEPIDGFKGGSWSLTLFGYNITDPLAGIASMIGGRGIYPPLILSMLLPVLFIVVFGRAFCAWICPMNTLFEINNWMRNKVEKYIFKPADVHFDRSYKYIALVVALILTASGISLLPYLLPYALVTRQPYYYIFYRTFGIGMVMILVMFLFEIFVSRRGWCRYMCPGGAFFSLLSPMRFVKVNRNASECIAGCRRCTESCKMGLLPHEDKTGMECDNCGLCVSECPSNAMKYKVAVSSQQSAAGKKTLKAMIIIFALLTVQQSLINEAHAAHAKMINPHAQDSENTGELTYPMAPSDEHSTIVDGYLISFSAFQFAEMEQRGHKVKSVITIRDGKGNPYQGPLNMDIVEMGFFGVAQESSHSFKEPFANQYKRFDWFQNDARCKVRIYFSADGKQVRAEFPVKVGDPLPSGMFLSSIGVMLVSVIGLVVYVNKKRGKEKFVPAG